MRLNHFIESVQASGGISFTIDDLIEETGVSRNSAWSSIKRLKKKKLLASPSRGYYLILSPEFKEMGCVPADWFLDGLMEHLGIEYYVGLLSAAMFYGAAHQQPQMMQVMVEEPKRTIRCGSAAIHFIQNSSCKSTPVRKIKTRTGYMNVSSPEATARDLVTYMSQSGGVNRVAGVIDELVESIEKKDLELLAQREEGSTWIRRLGYLLDKVGASGLSDGIHPYLGSHDSFIPLVPYEKKQAATKNLRWKVSVNVEVESDLDDTN